MGGKRAIAFGLVSLCNHAAHPNARVESNREARALCLLAIKPIRPGEEILIRYTYYLPEWNG